MDHKWGREIYTRGLAGLGATMAARYPPFGQVWYLNRKVSSGGFLIVTVPPPDTEFFYSFNVQAVKPGFTNFPYGWDVEPDGPV